MARTHAQRFASDSLPRAVFGDALALTRAIACGEATAILAALWDDAGAEMAPIARVPGTGFAATLDRRDRYVTAIILPPPPRGSGDPAAMAIIGRGDGVDRLSTVAYFVLDLVLDPRTGAPGFTISSRAAAGDKGVTWNDGPLPDPRWLADHVFELYAGRTPDPRAGVAELPGWYWWYAFDGAAAVRAFNAARDDAERFDAVRAAPILLLPEMIDAAEIFVGDTVAARLRELRPYLRRAASLASAWQALADRLSSATMGSAASNAARALPVISEGRQYGALTRAQAYDLEAKVRARLAVLGVDSEVNHMLSQELFAAAAAAEQAPRAARASVAPPVGIDDPAWRTLFLEEIDLAGCVRREHDEIVLASEPAFQSHGGLRAGSTAWAADESSALARVVDSRWVFRTTTGAAGFARTLAATLGLALPAVFAPQLGDETLAFGDDVVIPGIRRTHILVVRVGRVVARLHASEGEQAAASRQVLHAAMLHPLAAKIAQRARQGLAAYWLAVAYPTNAVAALVHSPGYDANRLIQRYPLLALPELPAALATQPDPYPRVASSLASFQAQLRAHRWATYRETMLALVRALLATDMGDPRVNASHAHEIVSELGTLDPDPVWAQLDAECRARG
ncbi:MAG: hypothetical protein ACM31C_16790 [Acidobacteriota bacterium]